MGVLTQVEGLPWLPEPLSYSVTESSTPRSVGDSSGVVGTIAVTYPAGPNPQRWLAARGRRIDLSDTRKGRTAGKVDGISFSEDGSTATLSCIGRLGLLNLYGIQAQPFVGTLGDAFAYYLSLAGIVSDFTVESSIAARPVKIIGWHGELWYHLKALAAAQGCEIALVAGRVTLRPIRQREAIRGRDIGKAPGLPAGTLAQFVEVYHYQCERIVDAPIYPPNGWNDGIGIITVSAGETLEQVLELEASLSHVQQPVFRERFGPEHDATSVYAVSGNDGLNLTADAWRSRGGRVEVEINDDTTSVTVRVTAPTGLPAIGGGELTSFSLALASNSGGSSQYSALRLVGTGVRFTKTLLRFPTGISAEHAEQEVGITVDNPFLTDINDAYSAGAREARAFAGRKLGLTGSVTAINQIGDRGQIGLPTYAEIRARYAGKTYAQVKADTLHVGKTYGQVSQQWRDLRQDDYDNQAFGNAGGARVWHDGTGRYYRIREATLLFDRATFDAEDDLSYADVKDAYAGKTYAQVRALYAGMTYGDAIVAGVIASD